MAHQCNVGDTLGLIETAEDALTFLTAGKATFTIVSKKTGKRYTLHAKKAKKDKKKNSVPHFIRYVTGPNPQTDHEYLGYILPQSLFKGLIVGNAGNPELPAFKAFNWVIQQLRAGNMPDDLEFYHMGHCGKCGRELTVPESIRSGIGPVCAKLIKH